VVERQGIGREGQRRIPAGRRGSDLASPADAAESRTLSRSLSSELSRTLRVKRERLAPVDLRLCMAFYGVMANERIDSDHQRGEYYVLPEEAIQFLPAEWQESIQGVLDDGRAILESVDSDITSLARLVAAFPAMACLRYAHSRLTSTTFAPTTEWYFENDMLTSAFAVAYVRVVDGGIGSGVSRKRLPSELRHAHDEIIKLRNKRFAHNDSHDTVEGMLEVQFDNSRFDVIAKVQAGYYVGGAKEWAKLVGFMDELMSIRLRKILDRLSDKTGYEWTFPSGPPPSWVDPGQS
jgi:hypothetical protein